MHKNNYIRIHRLIGLRLLRRRRFSVEIGFCFGLLGIGIGNKKRGREWNEKTSQKKVSRELKRNPRSEYSVGEKLIIRVSVPVAPGSKQRGKRLTEVVVTGTVEAVDRRCYESQPCHWQTSLVFLVTKLIFHLVGSFRR